MIRTVCDSCGCDVAKPVSVYLKNKRVFCSKECYWKYKRMTSMCGIESPHYHRVKIACANCGVEISVTPSEFAKKNKYGDHHNFCSQRCYWDFRKAYYVGEKSATYGLEITDERKRRMRDIFIKNARSSKRLDSSIQLKINGVLDEMGVSYIREYVIGYYAIDNYLDNNELFIEVMGDYWHSSPLKYNEQKYGLNEMQFRTLVHDKQKHTYIKNKSSREILYIWESDINKDLDMCKKLITKYIQNNGFLEDYNSFNYHLQEDGSIILNESIIYPYQHQSSDKYRHLLNKTG